MRTKGIPDDVIGAVKSHPYIAVGGLLIAGLFVYGYSAQSNAAAATEASTTVDPSGYLGYGLNSFLGYSAPVAYSAGSTSAATDTGAISTSNGLGVSSTDLLDFEKLKESHSYELDMKALQTQADIAAANNAVQAAGITSANYQAASALAQTFMLSGNDLGGGIVAGPGGTNLVYSFANHVYDNSTYGQGSTRFENNIRGHSIENFLNQSTVAISNVNNNLKGDATAARPVIAGTYGVNETFQ